MKTVNQMTIVCSLLLWQILNKWGSGIALKLEWMQMKVHLHHRDTVCNLDIFGEEFLFIFVAVVFVDVAGLLWLVNDGILRI